jgi:SAM-dependent methyltransferase
VSDTSLLDTIRTYYTTKLDAFGPTPAGVDWNSVESQQLRFEQLVKVCDPSSAFSLIDYGCGYGAMVDYLLEQDWGGAYVGFDIAASMIAVAVKRHVHRPQCHFTSDESTLVPVEYAVASGILNVKLDAATEVWERYVLMVLDRLHGLSTRGFAFNVLTSYSDRERMRSDLYYADPCRLFDHCKRHYSRHVALLHDYDLYEFTILVRK